MLAQERLEQLKRQKTPYSTEELDRRGWQRYAEIRTDLVLSARNTERVAMSKGLT